MAPLVSIIIPSFNAAGTILLTLKSACAQTWPNIEIIVVDDGSTDGTAEVAERAGFERMKVVRQENQGACVARNRGIELADGEYIQFLDADDILSPGKIADQVNRLLSLPPGHVAYGTWDYIDAAGKFAGSGLRLGRDFSPGLSFLVSSLRSGYMVPPHSWLTPRSIVEKAGPWDPRLVQNQDGEFFSRVLTHAVGAAWVETAVCYYRRHVSGSVSQQRSTAADQSLLLAAELIKYRLESSGLVEGERLSSAVYLRALYRLEGKSEAGVTLWERAVATGLPSRSIRLGRLWFRVLYRVFGWRIAFDIRRAQLAVCRRLGINYRR